MSLFGRYDVPGDVRMVKIFTNEQDQLLGFAYREVLQRLSDGTAQLGGIRNVFPHRGGYSLTWTERSMLSHCAAVGEAQVVVLAEGTPSRWKGIKHKVPAHRAGDIGAYHREQVSA
mgnify:FL=1